VTLSLPRERAASVTAEVEALSEAVVQGREPAKQLKEAEES
jgi:hypothetical protein